MLYQYIVGEFYTIISEGKFTQFQWEFTVYKDENICYSDNSIVNIFERTPAEAGDYTIIARVTDDSGFAVSYSKQYPIT